MPEDKLSVGTDLERQIVAFALADRNFFVSINSILKPQHFSVDAYGTLWAFSQKYFQSYLAPPTFTVLTQALREAGVELDLEALKAQLAVTEPSIKAWLQDKVVRIIRDFEFKKLTLEMAGETDRANPDYEKFEPEMKRILTMKVDLNLGTNYFDAEERIPKILALEQTKIPTRFPSIDAILDGGICRKELWCWMSPPGVGKSLWLVNLGKNFVLQGKKVVHYTLEMSEERVGMRYDCSLLGMTTREILGDIKGVCEKLGERRKLLKDNLWIKEYPTASANVNQIRAHLTKLKEYKEFVPDIVIVDYGDIMLPIRHGKSADSYEDQGNIFEELRGIAVEYDVPIITATQSNRLGLTKDLAGMGEVGDSFRKVRIIDALFSIICKPEDKAGNVMKLFVAKARNSGSQQLIGYEVDYAKMQLKDCGPLDKSGMLKKDLESNAESEKKDI